MNKIFISYRRDDTAPVCGRIYDRLCTRFGRDNVFKDVEGIPLGVNFEEYVGSVVAQCAVQLVIIGPSWVNAATQAGERRLDDPHDLVRIEVEAALKRNIPVIPIMVQGAALPHSATLPPSIQGLIGKNGLSVGNDPHFDPDMNLLIASLDQWLATTNAPMASSPAPATWPSPMTSPGMGAGAPPGVPTQPNMPSAWQGAPMPTAPVGGSPGYGASTSRVPGGSMPLPQAGGMVAPQLMGAPTTPIAPPASAPYQPKMQRTGLIIGIVAAVLLVSTISAVLLANHSTTPSSSSNSSQPPAPLASSTPAPVWNVILNQVNHAPSYNGYSANAGYHYLLFDFSFANVSSQQQILSGQVFDLQDNTGQHYQEDQASNPGQSFEVNAGQSIEAIWAFVVPNAQCKFVIYFIPSTSAVSSWTVTSTYPGCA